MNTTLDGHLIAQARTQAAAAKEPLLTVLARLLGRAPEALLSELGAYVHLPVLSRHELDAMTPDFSELSYTDCLQRQCLLLQRLEALPVFVCADPFDDPLQSWAAYRIGGSYVIALASPTDLQTILRRLEDDQPALAQLFQVDIDAHEDHERADISLESIAQDESQVVKLLNSSLYDAHKSGASDIHLETGPQGLTIKYRIDGVLSVVRRLPDPVLAEQIISRIKVMADLDIGEQRIPQDGRFAVTFSHREVDLRVSIMPGLFGEDAVLRILDKQMLTAELQRLDLAALGFDALAQQRIRRLATQPYGMLLVTGPTGSGKTTTLYATVSEINNGKDKIITIEDPVEYQLPDVLQIPVNEHKGLTFAKGLRSILRHDPDKILVGEIRDHETAEIAVQAALTGHLVFTTVHANNAFDVISRFRYMGVDAYSFVTALNGIVAQRLVRLNCEHCAETVQPEAALLADSGLRPEEVSGYRFRQGRGCAHCHDTGYKGRKVLAEILLLNDRLRELILQHASVASLKEEASALGMQFIRAQALVAVRDGLTTLQEINNVTFVE